MFTTFVLFQIILFIINLYDSTYNQIACSSPFVIAVCVS